jgi:hypothetical protein
MFGAIKKITVFSQLNRPSTSVYHETYKGFSCSFGNIFTAKPWDQRFLFNSYFFLLLSWANQSFQQLLAIDFRHIQGFSIRYKYKGGWKTSEGNSSIRIIHP